MEKWVSISKETCKEISLNSASSSQQWIKRQKFKFTNTNSKQIEKHSKIEIIKRLESKNSEKRKSKSK